MGQDLFLDFKNEAVLVRVKGCPNLRPGQAGAEMLEWRGLQCPWWVLLPKLSDVNITLAAYI